MSLGGRHVAVTGGAGFIGSHLVEHLLQHDVARLVVFDDLSTGQRDNVPKGVELIEGDVRSAVDVAGLGEADLVFHLAVKNVRASLGRPEENFAVNADGTLQVLEAMRAGRQGAFVYVSSSEVYGIPESGEYREDRVPAPTTVYGAGKLAGEHITIAYRTTYGLDTRVVRPFNNYGPRSHFEGDSGEVIPKFILRALADRPLIVHGDGSQTRDFMFVKDTARWLANLASVDRLAGQTVNIGTGRDTSVNELAQLILELTGSSAPIEHAERRPGDLPRLCADTAKVSEFVDFSLDTDLETGLRQTVAFFQQFDPHELLRREVERNWA